MSKSRFYLIELQVYGNNNLLGFINNLKNVDKTKKLYVKICFKILEKKDEIKLY